MVYRARVLKYCIISYLLSCVLNFILHVKHFVSVLHVRSLQIKGYSYFFDNINTNPPQYK